MRTGLLLVASLTLALQPACSSDPEGGDDEDGGGVVADGSPGGPDAKPGTSPDASTSPSDAGPQLISLKRCTGRTFVPGTKEPWNHSIVSAGIALATPYPSSPDVLTTATTQIAVSATITYGLLLVDLEDEKIRLYIDDCSAWKPVTSVVSNTDGVVSYTFPSLAYGIYDIKWEVAGDLTTVPARLYVLPKQTHLAVFDIDGTLTTSDTELWEDLLTGDYVAQAYEGAVDLTKAFEAVGYVPVYLTGRPYFLSKVTRTWLADLKFAGAPLVLASTTSEALPTESGVGNFKKAKLAGWKNAGLLLDFAHGNAATDIYAYLGAGIAASAIYIIGDHAGEQGTVAVTGAGAWLDRAAAVKKLPKVAQPFSY